MRISEVGYFEVTVEKKMLNEFTDGNMKEAFEGQRAVRVTVRLVVSSADRARFSKAAGVRLGSKLPLNMFEEPVSYNGYYCASPDLSIYSVTYAAKPDVYDDSQVPAPAELVKSVFEDDVE
eukprot:1182831-Prymnesium_polylepis.1